MVKKVVVRETVTESTEETSDSNMPKTVSPGKRKKYTKKTITHSSKPMKKKMNAAQREEMLIENFVGLQHAMTNLSIKFGDLSNNISGLLSVFEEAARNFASGGRSDDKDMLKKINSLLEQNKTIARGLVLMEGKLRGRNENQEENQSQMPPQQPPFSDNSNMRSRPLPSI